MKKITVILLAVLMLFAFIACENDSGINRTVIEDSEGFKNAVAAGGFYSINDDLSVDSNEQIKFAENFDIALNGHKLSSTAQFIISGAEVSFSNGSVAMNCTKYINEEGEEQTLNKGNSAVELLENSTLSLSGVNYTSNITGIFAVNNNDRITLNITDNSIVDVDGYYALGTNATQPDVSNDINFKITDSTITSAGAEGTDYDNTAILFNVQGHVTIENSTVSGDRQAMIARGGNYVFTNTTFEATGENSINKTDKGNYLNENYWGSGNEVPLAALVIGNNSTSAYDYSTSAELENVIIKAPEKNNADVDYYGIYVWQNNDTDKVSVSGTLSAESTNKKVNTENMNNATYDVN